MPNKNREIQLENQRKHYRNNKEIFLNRSSIRRRNRRKWLINVLNGCSCFFCDENVLECLDFHHIDPSSKEEEVPKLLNDLRSMERVISEIEKCVILCANCHRKFHAGIIKFDFDNTHAFKIEEKYKNITI